MQKKDFPYEEPGIRAEWMPHERDMLHALLQSAEYGILATGLDRQDLIANAKLALLFSIPARSVVETDPDSVRAWAVSQVASQKQFLEGLERAYSDPWVSFTDEIELKCNPPKLLRRSTAPIIGRDGKPVARLWTFLDVTEVRMLQKQVQKDLEETTEALQEARRQMVQMEKLSTVGLLASGVVHDIRNIMSALQLEMAMLPAEAIQTLQPHLNRFQTLTHRLLAYSKPGMTELRPTDMGKLTAGMAALLKTQMEMHCIELKLTIPSVLPCVHADASQLEQALVNLCLNALQALPPEGGWIEIRLRDLEEWVEVTVRDNGPGIAAELLPHIFHPFFTTRSEGIGLGLYSCRRIAEENGGQLTVSSTPGKGAVFTLLLPSCQPPGDNLCPEF